MAKDRARFSPKKAGYLKTAGKNSISNGSNNSKPSDSFTSRRNVTANFSPTRLHPSRLVDGGGLGRGQVAQERLGGVGLLGMNGQEADQNSRS
jgi:hypothetical protein